MERETSYSIIERFFFQKLSIGENDVVVTMKDMPLTPLPGNLL